MAESLQSLSKPPSSAESDGDLDLSVYLTPKEQRDREKEKERKKRSRDTEIESPNLTEKQRVKLDETSPFKIQLKQIDSIKKVLHSGLVTNSPFLNTDMGSNSTDVPVDKPNGIKPYRDYLDP